MKNKILGRLCLIFLLSITFNISAQKKSSYVFPKRIPQKYIFDATAEFKEMMSHKPKGISKAKYSRFSEMMSYEKRSQFLSGGIYIGWEKHENYVNAILQKILPVNLRNDPRFHVYLARLPDYNAYAIHDGSFFFNIGLLADLKNEASIALVLGHEFSHYIGNDALDKYKTRTKLMRKHNRNKFNFDLRIKNAHSDRQQEHEADSLGFILANAAGYNIDNGLNLFFQFLDIDKKFESIKKKNLDSKNKNNKVVDKKVTKTADENDTLEIDIVEIIEKMLATHPENLDRIKYLRKVSEKITPKGEQDFIIDEQEFHELQLDARIETLELLIKQFRYSECVERAFTYYLFEPENDTYLYYLCEAIRRNLVFKPRFKTKGFLTDEYKNIFKKNHGILHNLRVLIRDSANYENIKAKELLVDTALAFETYEEAFTYFKTLALKRKIPEAFLTAALYENPRSETQKKYLETYIAMGDIRFKAYAENLVQNKLSKALKTNKKEIILFDDLSFLEDHYYGLHDRKLKSEKKNEEYINKLEAFVFKEFPDKDFVRLTELKQSNLNKAVDYLSAMQTMTMLEIVKNREQLEQEEEDAEAEEEANKDKSKKKKKKERLLSQRNYSKIYLI